MFFTRRIQHKTFSCVLWRQLPCSGLYFIIFSLLLLQVSVSAAQHNFFLPSNWVQRLPTSLFHGSREEDDSTAWRSSRVPLWITDIYKTEPRKKEEKNSVKHLMSWLLCSLLHWSGQNNLIMLNTSFKTSAKAAVRCHKSPYIHGKSSVRPTCVRVCVRACVFVCVTTLPGPPQPLFPAKFFDFIPLWRLMRIMCPLLFYKMVTVSTPQLQDTTFIN